MLKKRRITMNYFQVLKILAIVAVIHCQSEGGACSCQDDEECVINSNLEWECVEKLNGNETCERDDDDDERERSGSENDSKSESTNSKSMNTTDIGGSDDESDATDIDRERSNTPSRNRTATLSSLPEKVLLLLSSRDERDEEEKELDRIRGSSVGAVARRLLRNIQTTSDSCRSGFYCKKTSRNFGTCSPVNQNGPCYSTSTNPDRDCDENGFYKPRICSENDSGDTECVCVLPENGTAIEDTRVIIRSEDDDDDDERPECSDRVYGSCSITYRGRTFQINHGRTHFDNCNCRECECYFGELYCGEAQSACRSRCLNNPSSCTLEDGSVLAHGESVESDCNRCGCRNGRLICSRYECANAAAAAAEEEDECERCSRERINRVCGPDRRTYPNICAAVNCFGWDSDDVLQGHCNSHNPCVQYPCERGEICLRRGGVSCLAQGGCSPDDVRVCVNITQLPCNFTATFAEEEDSSDDGELGSGDIDSSDTAVCGSDGNSYPAICHVIPRHVSVNVLHAGRCDNGNCRGGQVCGTDGATYENVCVLRSLSSNARVDYRGECIEADGTFDEYCQAVMDQDLCPYTSENCDDLVQPSAGCCPICGSAIILLLDTEQLQDAASVISTFGTLDDLVADLLQAGFFSEILGICRVEPTLTNDGQLELVFSSILPENQDVCIARAQTIVTQINSFISNTSGRKRQADDAESLPSSYQYVVGAVTAPSTDSNVSEGATTAAASILFLITMTITALLF